jgi:two-component system, LytTR family, sensor kinase
MNKFRKTELAAATGIYLLIIFSLLFKSVVSNIFELQHEYGYKFVEYHQVFDYYKHYLLPLLAYVTFVYAAFVFIHARVVPYYLEQQKFFLGITFSLLTCAVVFLAIMISNTWYYGYLFGVYRTVKGVYTHCVKQAFIITIFYAILYILYYSLRYFYLDYLQKKVISKPWFKEVRIELLVIFGMLLACIMAGFNLHDEKAAFVMCCIGIYYGLIYFVCQYKIFPNYQKHKNKRELGSEIILISLSGLALTVFLLPVVHHGPALFFILLFLYFFEAAVVLPLSWWIYRARHSNKAAFQGLQKALDHSEAGLDFLRWQINPHFLFNALNTLYGTALQEKAAATGEGIQKLGDMMRFMLHDNVLESISLDKEIAYLQNYIALQRLRTQGSPDILIEVNINDTHCDHEIAPMLLIPFVENAFKYGVSQRNRSRISVSLSCSEDKIYFDVFNTVHALRSPDMEYDSMGIGLNNVKQRLALLYPGKHDLSIRETNTEFFVHLTIQIG